MFLTFHKKDTRCASFLERAVSCCSQDTYIVDCDLEQHTVINTHGNAHLYEWTKTEFTDPTFQKEYGFFLGMIRI